MIQTYQVRRDVSSLVSFRLTDEMKKEVDAVAAVRGLTRSEFLRLGIEVWLRILSDSEGGGANK